MYEYVKILHIVAVMLWLSGMMLTPLLLGLVMKLSPESREIYVLQLRRLFHIVISPAMIVTWVLGLTLAVWAGWFGSVWMTGKIVLVVLFSGFHGFFSGQLRRLAGDGEFSPLKRLWILTPVQIVLVTLVVFLVVLKPG